MEQDSDEHVSRLRATLIPNIDSTQIRNKPVLCNGSAGEPSAHHINSGQPGLSCSTFLQTCRAVVHKTDMWAHHCFNTHALDTLHVPLQWHSLQRLQTSTMQQLAQEEQVHTSMQRSRVRQQAVQAQSGLGQPQVAQSRPEQALLMKDSKHLSTKPASGSCSKHRMHGRCTSSARRTVSLLRTLPIAALKLTSRPIWPAVLQHKQQMLYLGTLQ